MATLVRALRNAVRTILKQYQYSGVRLLADLPHGFRYKGGTLEVIFDFFRTEFRIIASDSRFLEESDHIEGKDEETKFKEFFTDVFDQATINDPRLIKSVEFHGLLRADDHLVINNQIWGRK